MGVCIIIELSKENRTAKADGSTKKGKQERKVTPGSRIRESEKFKRTRCLKPAGAILRIDKEGRCQYDRKND